jgi:hypothetical protein
MKIRTMVVVAAIVGMRVQAQPADETVTVYVTNDAMVPLTILCPARALATKMLARAKVRILWRAGRPDDSPSLRDSTLVARLETQTPWDRMPGALGFARPHEGVHITIFYDRIERQALGNDSRTLLLAYVLVHEITHALQGENRHAETGIMKAHWEPSDYYQIARNPFTEDDVDLIHRGLLMRRP